MWVIDTVRYRCLGPGRPVPFYWTSPAHSPEKNIKDSEEEKEEKEEEEGPERQYWGKMLDLHAADPSSIPALHMVPRIPAKGRAKRYTRCDPKTKDMKK